MATQSHHFSLLFGSVGKMDIETLPVKCDNVERGCEWEGTVGTLDEHVAVCKFTPVPCPNQCKENYVIRKYLDIHINNECPDHKCPYCGEKDTYANITQIHDSVCRKKKIPCTNVECTETIEHEKMKRHLDVCDYTIIPCKYKNIGCDVELKRKDVRLHENNGSIHFHLVLGAVIKLQDNLQSAKDTIAAQQDEADTLRDEVKSANDTIVALNSEVATLRDEVRSAKNTIVALNSKVSKLQGSLPHTLGEEKSLTFKLTDFEEHKKCNGTFRSPSFYTSPEGYHLEVKVYANGYGYSKGTHVSVFLEALKGEHDGTLKWPFTGVVTFQLLNQLRNGNHHSLKTHGNSLCVGQTWGFKEYISHSKLARDTPNNTEYLKNDTLYFKVSLELSDHKPWLKCIRK